MQASRFVPFDLAHRSAGERLIIWGLRTAVAARATGDHPITYIRHVFDQFGVADAAAALERVLDLFARTAHATLALHGVGCRCLSPSETSLLAIVAAAQSGDMAALRAGLSAWLPAHVLDWAEPPLCCLAHQFAAAGLALPCRPMLRRAPGSRSDPGAASRATLH